MKIGTMLVATLALVSLPLVAQQSAPESSPSTPSAMQPSSPAGPQSTSPAAGPERPGNSSAASGAMAGSETAPAASATSADLRTVSGELVSKLDTKTAKTGDDVIVQTKAAVKTAEGTEIPKGSKLMGHVIAVQASTDSKNSQVALQFDHAELNGGQSIPIRSEIESIGSAEGATPDSAAMSGPPSSGSTSAGTSTPGSASSAAGTSSPGTAPTAASGPASGHGAPPAGTIVGRNGNIAIRTTSIPNVLLANNAPGQQDPRMGQSSGILLGARQDVQLASGTPVVVGVSATARSTK